MAGESLTEVTDSNFAAEVIESKTPVLVDFWAEWCAPCRMVTPVLEEIAKEFSESLKVVQLDVDTNKETAAKYGIMSIPTVALFRDGKIAKQVIGALPKEALVKELGL